MVIVVVNLDPHYVQSGWIDLDLPSLGIDEQDPDPATIPAHVLGVEESAVPGAAARMAHL